MDTCIYTSFNKRYLPRALVLASRLAHHQPDAWRVAVIVDELTEAERALVLTHFNEVILSNELFPEDEFPAWMFGHDVVEACTAVKGQALVALLDRGYGRIIYLDPDITLLHSMDRVLSGLSEHSILITPHVVDPEESDGPIENERCCLSYGVYNLGFLAVRNDANARRLARWWCDRLWRFCMDDPTRGLFTDQKWFDLVPGLFDGVHVLRDPGHNVASWNLVGRRVSITTDKVVVNGSHPVVFFHFTKVRGVGDLMLQRNALNWAPVKEIYEWYLRQVNAKEAFCAKVNDNWAYARYSNGEPIALAHRRTFRSEAGVNTVFRDPFQSGPGTYYEWLRTTGKF